MAAQTKNDILAEVRELKEISEKYSSLPAGPARNMMHHLHFGILRLEAELAAGERERDSVARYKRRKAQGLTGREQAIEFPS